MRRRLHWIPATLLMACAANNGTEIIDFIDAGPRRDAGRVDTGRPGDAGTVTPGRDGGACRDTDRDGISDDAEGAPSVDTDRDGMPDAWETAHGLDPATAAPAAQTLSTGDAGIAGCTAGYTDLECYLNELAATVITR